ncbi:MAG: copper chaperone PCu(A)C, partial [Pseudomonadota bacterium]
HHVIAAAHQHGCATCWHGDHVMFMGLTGPFVDGETVEVTLTFEQAGDITVDIPVDLNRRPMVHDGHATN